jgi:chorismate-pyruvate lyase
MQRDKPRHRVPRLSGTRCLAVPLLAMLMPAATLAGDWPDTPLARTEALALLQTLNADLLSHPSATLTLERWCGAHRLAAAPTVIARRDRKADKPLPEDLRRALGIGADTPVRYRRVQLACGGRVLSEADNWYLPGRLTAAMNHALDQGDTPFGKVVAPLHFRRHTLSAQLLWSPLPQGWEMHGLPAATEQPLALPHHLLQHRALLEDAQGRPFSALVETYTEQVLAFPPPAARQDAD